jgi:hypothetical protein
VAAVSTAVPQSYSNILEHNYAANYGNNSSSPPKSRDDARPLSSVSGFIMTGNKPLVSASSNSRHEHKKIELAMSNEVLKSHLKQELRRKILAERCSTSATDFITNRRNASPAQPSTKPWDDLTSAPKWQKSTAGNYGIQQDSDRGTIAAKDRSPVKSNELGNQPTQLKSKVGNDGADDEWADAVYRKNVAKGKWPFITGGVRFL